MSEKTQKELADLLSSYGVRPTQQRLTVYRYLITHPIHPTVDTIYSALSAEHPTFSRTTIYSTVYLLVEAGLARVLHGPGDEQRFDGNPKDHGHFYCLSCGKVFDFPLEQSVQQICPDRFSVTSRDVSLTGFCPACSKKASS